MLAPMMRQIVDLFDGSMCDDCCETVAVTCYAEFDATVLIKRCHCQPKGLRFVLSRVPGDGILFAVLTGLRLRLPGVTLPTCGNCGAPSGATTCRYCGMACLAA